MRTYIIYISVISTLFCLVQFYRENAVAYMHFNRTADRAKLRPIYSVIPVFFSSIWARIPVRIPPSPDFR